MDHDPDISTFVPSALNLALELTGEIMEAAQKALELPEEERYDGPEINALGWIRGNLSEFIYDGQTSLDGQGDDELHEYATDKARVLEEASRYVDSIYGYLVDEYWEEWENYRNDRMAYAYNPITGEDFLVPNPEVEEEYAEKVWAYLVMRERMIEGDEVEARVFMESGMDPWDAAEAVALSRR